MKNEGTFAAQWTENTRARVDVGFANMLPTLTTSLYITKRLAIGLFFVEISAIVTNDYSNKEYVR